MVRNGVRGRTQRYKCKACGRRFDGGVRRDKAQVITDKDAEDLLFILRKYFDIKLYKEDAVPPVVVDMNDDNLDTDIWGAQWLAYDISRLLTTEHLAFYSELIANEISKEEHSKLIYHFTKYYGGNSIDEPDFPYEPCRNIWKAFGEVLNNALEERRKQ